MTASRYSADVKVEVAFNAGVRTAKASRTWTDVSDYAELADGISVSGGRSDERATCDANTASLVLDNSDGRFTPEKASSPYYPNVKIGRPVRVTATYPPTAAANLLSAASADFESGTGSWTAGGTVPPTLTQSATFAYSGTYSLRIAWGTGGTLPLAQRNVTGLTISQVYTFAAWVYVPAGDPSVRLAVGGMGTISTASTTYGAWERIEGTFTATGTSHNLQVWPVGSPTAGDFAYVDGVMLVAGSEVGDFNTLTPTTWTRFEGYVDEWPTAWPTEVDSYAQARLSASSRLARMGSSTALRSLMEQEVLASAPVSYWPLSEAAGATQALSLGSSAQKLRLGNVGTNVVTFGSADGCASDESTAVQFVGGGGRLRSEGAVTVGSAMTWECVYVGRHASIQEVLYLEDADTGAWLEVFARSDPSVTFVSGDPLDTVAGGAAVNVCDGLPHHIAIVRSTTTVTLYVDGVEVDTDTNGAYGGIGTAVGLKLGRVISSVATDKGALSHVAFFNSALSAGTIAAHSAAALTGITGESAADRLARLMGYAGVAAAETSVDAAAVTPIAHFDITGMANLEPMRRVETTDGGVLHDSRDNTLTYRSRAGRYQAASALTLSMLAHEVQADITPQYDRAYLANDVTATGVGGVVARAVDAASITDYDPAQLSIDLDSADPIEADAAAAWRVAVYAQPQTRIPNLTIDLLSLDPAKVAAALALDVGSLLTVTDWPTQAAVTSLDLFVEGYSETIGMESHTLTLNVSRADSWLGTLILDDAVRGELDAYTLAY